MPAGSPSTSTTHWRNRSWVAMSSNHSAASASVMGPVPRSDP